MDEVMQFYVQGLLKLREKEQVIRKTKEEQLAREKEQDIPIGSDEVLTKARMIYTFDVFHAMTSERCYRNAMEPRLVMEIMTEECHREMTFDGSVLDFLKRRYCL